MLDGDTRRRRAASHESQCRPSKSNRDGSSVDAARGRAELADRGHRPEPKTSCICRLHVQVLMSLQTGRAPPARSMPARFDAQEQVAGISGAPDTAHSARRTLKLSVDRDDAGSPEVGGHAPRGRSRASRFVMVLGGTASACCRRRRALLRQTSRAGAGRSAPGTTDRRDNVWSGLFVLVAVVPCRPLNRRPVNPALARTLAPFRDAGKTPFFTERWLSRVLFRHASSRASPAFSPARSKRRKPLIRPRKLVSKRVDVFRHVVAVDSPGARAVRRATC